MNLLLAIAILLSHWTEESLYLRSSTLRILSGVCERGCNSMVQGSQKFLDISVGGSALYNQAA